MNWKKPIQGIAAGVAYLSLSALLMSILIFGAVQTDRGKEYLVKILQRVLAEERIRIGRVTGFVPFHFQVDHLAAADPHGDWLVLRGIQIQWSPLHLLKGDLRFARLGADTMEMPRRPPKTAAKTTGWKTGGPWYYLLQRLRLENFFINRLDLGEPLLGRQASFSLKANMRASFQRGFLETRITIDQLEGGNARLTAEATASPGKENLRIRAGFEEPAGGVLARAMGFEGPLLFSLEGEGTMKDWKGSLKGSVGPLGTMDSKIHLSKAKDSEVTFTGSFKIDRSHLPEALAAWVSEETSLTFVARSESAERVALEQLSFNTGQISLELRGMLDLEGNRSKLDLSLVSRDLSSMGLFLDSGASGTLTARGTLSGSPQWPKAVLDIRLENPALSRVRALGLESRWDIDPLDRGGSFPSRFQVKGEGRLRDLVATEQTLMFPKSIAWSGEAEVSPGAPVRIRRFLMNSGKISAALEGEVDPRRAKGHVALSLELGDSTPLNDFLGIHLPFLAGTSLRGNFRGDLKEKILFGSIQGQAKIQGEPIPTLAPLVPREVSYSLGFSVSGDKEIVLSGAEFKAAGGTVQGDLSLDLLKKTIRTNWNLRLPDLSPLSATLKWPLEGSLTLKGFTEGPFSRIKTRAEFHGENLLVRGVAFNEASAEIHVIGVPPELSGSFSLEMLCQRELLFSEGRFDLDGSRLHLPHISFKGAGISLNGKVDMLLAQGAIEGELKGRNSDLSALSSLFRKELSGSVEINSQFRIADESRNVLLDLRGKGLGGFGGYVQTAELHAQLKGTAKAPSGTASLKLAGLRLGDLGLSGLEVTTVSDGHRITYSALIKGHYKQSLEVMTSGEVLLFSATQEMAIHRLQGLFGKMPITLIQPATLVRSQGSITMVKLLCSLGEGRFEAGGSFETGELKVNSRFEKLPLSLVSSFRPSALKNGVASGEIALHGPPHELEGELEIQVHEFAVQHRLTTEFPPASLDFTAILENHLLQSHLTVKGLTGEPLRASLEVPMNLSLTPLLLAVPPSGRLKGTLDGGMDLAHLTSFFALHDQMIRGTAIITLTLQGTPLEPNISGRIYATKGAYENYRTGTIIKDAEVEIEASNRDLRIKHAYGKDGEAGSITAEGWMRLDASQAFPFRVDFTVHHSKIARLDEATATMNGSGTFEGSFEKAALRGPFTIESAEIQIPKRLPPNLTEVDVIEIYGKEREAQQDQLVTNKNAKKDLNLFFDLSLRIPGRAVVSGRGLESEWQGDLTLRGKAGQSELKGTLSLVRGRFDLLSKRFDLTRGSISFSGATPPQPLLDMTGEARTKDLLARVQVTGLIQSLEIKLTSEPPYPADEILARLLFGRRLHQITPVQAVQLADALNTLRGSEGFDLLGRTRKLLRVDELTIGETGEKEDKPSVRVGKYVSENVYIKVESGVAPETGKASVEWQVTPNVTVETEVGVNASAGVGVNWRWDY